MYKDILKQIANTLFINVQQINQYGLLEGRLGIALFFYRYARYTSNTMFADFSDDYIEFIHDKLGKDFNKYFPNGLSGIGWCIDYLVKNKYVEVDEDEDILEEVDDSIFAMDKDDMLQEIEQDIPLFSQGLYALQRENNKLMHKALQSCSEFMEMGMDIDAPLAYYNSIFYFLNKSIMLNFETDYNDIMDKLKIHIEKRLAQKQFENSDLFILKNNVDHYKSLNPDTIGWDLINLVYSTKDILPDSGMIYTVYDYKPAKMDIKQIENIVSSAIADISSDNLCLHNGLAGIGLLLLMRISI